MADVNRCPELTRASVLAAHKIIKPFIHTTPVLTNVTLTELASTPQSDDDLVGTEWEGKRAARPRMRLWFKCENLQRVGAFKVRGAFHALLRLVDEEGIEKVKKMGVVTHSSGNHAQALSLASRTLGIPATIVMPTISTPSKIAATKSYGSNVIFSGSTSVEREKVVEEVIAKTGARLVPPYDHPDIILGQGTLGIELQEQVAAMIAAGGQADSGHQGSELQQEKCSFKTDTTPLPTSSHGKKEKSLDAIIAPCGGGGMLSGVALSCQDTSIRVFAAEPSYQGANDLQLGLSTGQRVESVRTLTIADGLRTPVGKYPWGIIHDRRLVSGAYSVTEEQIKAALRLVFERMKMVVEPSSVVGLATALYNEDFRDLVEREGGEEGWDLGIVVSGGNVSLEALGKMFEPELEEKEGEGRGGKSGEEMAMVVGERAEGKVGVGGERIAENVAG